jgi:hypothetical protein
LARAEFARIREFPGRQTWKIARFNGCKQQTLSLYLLTANPVRAELLSKIPGSGLSRNRAEAVHFSGTGHNSEILDLQEREFEHPLFRSARVNDRRDCKLRLMMPHICANPLNDVLLHQIP